MTTIEERVEAGAKWLDKNRPGWVDRINLNTLDLRSPCNCVLGQEYGDFWDRPAWLESTEPLGFDESQRRGAFERREDYFAAVNWEYTALTDTWRDYIVERRATVLPHGAPHCSCVIPCETCGADMLTTGYLAGCEECSERRQCAYDRAEFGDQLTPGGAS